MLGTLVGPKRTVPSKAHHTTFILIGKWGSEVSRLPWAQRRVQSSWEHSGEPMLQIKKKLGVKRTFKYHVRVAQAI